MKKFLFAAAIACLALFTSCDKLSVQHTGDSTGNLYGIWALDSKTLVTKDSEGKENTQTEDYSDFHFYLALSNAGVPHAIAKKGSLTALDLNDVDVDACRISYNEDSKQISFQKTVWLSEGLTHHMRLLGTYDVLTLSATKLVIQQELAGVKTIYSYTKQE